MDSGLVRTTDDKLLQGLNDGVMSFHVVALLEIDQKRAKAEAWKLV